MVVKFEKNLVTLFVVTVSVLAVLVCGNESPLQAKIGVQQPKDVKIYVEDHSRVLTKEEVDKLANKDSLPIAKPVDESDKNRVKPKLVIDNAGVIEGTANKIDDGGVKLPPIPIIMPNLPFNLFDSAGKSSDVDQSTSNDDADSSKPKGLIRLFIMHSSNNKPSDDDGEEKSADGSSGDSGVKSSSFVIFKIFSNSWGSLFGGPTDPDNEGSTNQKLLGGDDDVDKKRVHLLGGGGENDPDRIRFKLDEENQVFTGGDDLMINSVPIEQHKMMMMSMYDRIRNLFGMDMDQQSSSSDSDAVDSMSAPFIIRTDDGSSAIIPNDIGYAEKQQQSMNKCMMLSFMRLKASMYYRTILHLLFFTGVMLFILSLIMLTVRSLRRRRALRRPLSISTIETNGGANFKDAATSKFNSYRAWSGDMEQSLIGGGCDSKIVLIQAPPAYDQVIINDKTSALTHGPSSQLLTSNHKSTTTDDVDTKSLPPEYDESSVNNH